MSPPKRKPTKVPLLPGPGQKLDDYVSALHPSLFTNPSYFTPVVTGISGETAPTVAGVIIGTAREMFLAILISGQSVATAAAVSAPLKPSAASSLSVSWVGPPVVDMPSATMDEDGLITLPDWDIYGGDVLITGTILEA